MDSKKPAQGADVQGEGNYDAARRHREDVTDFVKSGQVERAARDAAPGDAAQAADLERAERAGKSHSKGEAPGDDAQMKDDAQDGGGSSQRQG